MRARELSFLKCLALVFLIPSFLIFTSCEEDAEEGLPCTIGASCDDGNANTINDVYDADCNCAGTLICPGSGDADGDGICADIDCDDNDFDNTETDADGDGICTPFDCDDTDASIYPGNACDDGNPNTYNDVYNANCECTGNTLASFKDLRDGQQYFIVEIGAQTWMAENLNYFDPSSQCYSDNISNCNIYGRLYNFQIAQSVCPAGWHLPTRAEWTTLTDHLGGSLLAGGKMKESGLAHWNSPNTGATNESQFSGLPGGYRTSSGSQLIGDQAFMWTASVEDAQNAYNLTLNKNTTHATITPGSKTNKMSVRCVQD